MVDNDLRKLSRKDLLEIILEQTNRIETLEQELEKAKLAIEDRKISIKESGSIAEASLKISEIFKSVDEAAEIYMNNVKELARKEERKLRKEAKEEKLRIIAEAEKKCKRKEELLDKKLNELEGKLNKASVDVKKTKNKKVRKK